MTNSTVRFGLIGFGAWGKFHALAKTKGVELKAITGRTDTTCQAVRDAFPQVDVHANYQELI